MKGCEVVLEHIVFADEESLPEEVVAGEPVHLQYMPATIVLRDVGKPWMLTGKASLDLPPSVPRRGLFQLQPSTVHIRRRVEGSRSFLVRRTQFAVLPADTRIVYAAQGATFGVVVADMLRPP